MHETLFGLNLWERHLQNNQQHGDNERQNKPPKTKYAYNVTTVFLR